jgi:hypothetical protein
MVLRRKQVQAETARCAVSVKMFRSMIPGKYEHHVAEMVWKHPQHQSGVSLPA